MKQLTNVLENSFKDLTFYLEKKVSEAKSKKEIISKVIEGYFEFGLKEKNLINSPILKSQKEDLEIRNYTAKLKKRINFKLKTYFKKFLERKKLDVIPLLLGTIDGIIIEASLFNKKLNSKKVISQILEIFFPAYEY